jgi:hypothetical protein
MASAVGAIGTGVMVLLGVWVVLHALQGRLCGGYYLD